MGWGALPWRLEGLTLLAELDTRMVLLVARRPSRRSVAWAAFHGEKEAPKHHEDTCNVHAEVDQSTHDRTMRNNRQVNGGHALREGRAPGRCSGNESVQGGKEAQDDDAQGEKGAPVTQSPHCGWGMEMEGGCGACYSRFQKKFVFGIVFTLNN